MNALHRSALAVVAVLALATPAVAALKAGDKAPDFKAQAYLAGKPFTFELSKALKKGPVVVYFFPAAHTPGCNLEAHLFSEATDKFKAEGATVIGLSAGNTDQLADFSKETEHCGGKFAVAADPGAKIAKTFDAVLEKKPEWSNRTSYVVAPDGTIAAVYSDLNPNQHVQAMLDGVKSIHAAKTKAKAKAK